MTRSFRRALFGALALPLVVATAVPANAVASVSRTVAQEAQVDWYTSTVDAVTGVISTTSVSVTVYVEAGVSRVLGRVSQSTCPADWTLPCTDNLRLLDGTPTTYTVNKAGTGATLVGNIQAYSDWMHTVPAGTVPISLTWTAVGEPTPQYGYKYRGYNLIEKVAGTWHQPALAVGTVGGLTPPAEAYAEMSIGTFTMITTTPNRQF